MIKVNGKEIEIGHFPDGTQRIRTKESNFLRYYIDWYYESEEELFTIYCLARHYRNEDVYLYMKYIPNARMDRVKNKDEVFTLKYFAEILNMCNFKEVRVLDAHSDVSLALINNVVNINPTDYVNDVIYEIEKKGISKNDVTMFYPDAGAAKRYSDMFERPYVYANKNRDWRTGEILGLEIAGDIENLVKGKDILIVDDICSRGGTFYYSAKKLKELGANKIYLYITHCENTILDGELIKSGLVEKIYTTNSIFTKEDERIEVIKL